MTNTKKIFLIFACLSLMIFIGTTVYTYAKYFTQAKEGIQTDIKKWNIKINDEDITTGKNISEFIKLNYVENEHVAKNTMAPSTETYFVMNIDYTNVEVNFKYEISIIKESFYDSNNNLITFEDLEITKVLIDEIPLQNLDPSNISYEVNNIDNETDKIKEIKVYVKWINDENKKLTNEDDTSLAINNEDLNLNVNLKFEQIIN